MKLIGKLLKWIFLILAALALIAVGYYLAVTKDVALSEEKLTFRGQNVCVYAADGVSVDDCLSGEIQGVRIEEVPEKTKLAFICVEDKRFYSHNGFDVKRIVKAFLHNLRAGKFAQGASTISQQLVKNTHLSQEKTLTRKLREWKLTRELEQKYSKDEILEKYLSVIYFGHDCFGLKKAARFYFNKEVNELDLADSAILAGLVKSPNNYSPFKNAENCKKRKETVLNLMEKNGAISASEKKTALAKALPDAQTDTVKSYGYLHFVFDELALLSEEYDFTVGGKVEIHTYLDKKSQSALESIAKNHVDTDKIFTVLDNQTHGYKACVSSVGAIRRLPGSLIKPLLVYAPALEENLISPATPILDEKINYAGYAPQNYDAKFRGYVSARESLSCSLNVPAVKLLECLGLQKGERYLSALGLPVEKDDLSLALALGGMKNGYTLHDLLAAYSALACGGNYAECGFIKEIKIDGVTCYKHTPKDNRVFSEETAYLTTDMLRTAASKGTAKKLRGLPFQIAAKTGTAGTDNGNTDAYAVSYTSSDTVGVWLGNAAGGFIDYTGGGLPCNYLREINERLYENYRAEKGKIAPFTRPKGVTSVKLDKIGYHDEHILSLADELAPKEYTFVELFKNGATPLSQSTCFTNPCILEPEIRYENGKVCITFHDSRAPLYRYKIIRYDYTTHSTLYDGEYTREFTDDKLTGGKTYVYTIIPTYKNQVGKEIVLPSVHTSINAPNDDEKVMEKEWWND